MGIFIGNLEAGTTTSDLLDFLEDHEGVTDIEVIKRQSPKGEVRFGHIFFRAQSDVDRAIKQQQTKDLHGSMVSVRKYVKRAENNDRRGVGTENVDMIRLERRQLNDRRFQFA